MTPAIYLKVGLGLLLAGFGATGVLAFKHLAGKAATAEVRIEAAEAKTKKAVADLETLQRDMQTLAAETLRRDEAAALIRASRAETTHRLDEAQREDPVAHDHLGERIPDSVRRAYLGDAPKP